MNTSDCTSGGVHWIAVAYEIKLPPALNAEDAARLRSLIPDTSAPRVARRDPLPGERECLDLLQSAGPRVCCSDDERDYPVYFSDGDISP